MQKDKEVSKLYDRAGLWETKSKQASARGDFDKAGRYRTKALRLMAQARNKENSE